MRENGIGRKPSIRSIQVDYNDPKDLKKWISTLQERRKNILRDVGADYIHFNGSNYSVEKILPVFESILDTDLSEIYLNDGLRDYYVYVHCDPTRPLVVKNDVKQFVLASRFGVTHEPFYVGKGRGNRWLHFERNDSHRKIRSNLIRQGKEVSSLKILEGATLSEALSLESKIIDILGLRSLSRAGNLVNLGEGLDATRRRCLYPKRDGWTLRILQRNGFNVSAVV